MYSICQSSFYEFDTYFGLRTKSIYRVDKVKIKYGVHSEKDAITRITQHEGGKEFVISTTEKIECLHCNHIFHPAKPNTEGFEEEKLVYAT